MYMCLICDVLFVVIKQTKNIKYMYSKFTSKLSMKDLNTLCVLQS